MKRIILAVVALSLFAGGAHAAKSAAELEKEKAMANPYPNDLGPDSLDVSGYTNKEGYKLLTTKCAKCHSASRPLNSRFAEPSAAAKIAPYKDKNVLQVEDKVWNRYVKRMMAKPGCDIPPAEGKKIWEFLVEDSAKRKSGDAQAAYIAHREKLIAEFKTKHPKRYEELKKANDL
jgi:hypothetical protein